MNKCLYTLTLDVFIIWYYVIVTERYSDQNKIQIHWLLLTYV